MRPFEPANGLVRFGSIGVVDANAIEAGLEGRTADVATNLIADRAGDTEPGEADLIGGAGGAALGAVVAIGQEIDATTVAADQIGSAGGVASSAMPLIAIEEEALAAAFGAAALAPALAAPASGALTAVAVGVAVLADLLAARPGSTSSEVCQGCSEGAAEESLQGIPPPSLERLDRGDGA
jgi:hypothetical protein